MACARVGVEGGGLFEEFDGDVLLGEEQGEEEARGPGADDDYFLEGHCRHRFDGEVVLRVAWDGEGGSGGWGEVYGVEGVGR